MAKKKKGRKAKVGSKFRCSCEVTSGRKKKKKKR
jgi:hypothetical protein